VTTDTERNLRAELAVLVEVQRPALLSTRGPIEGDAADVAGRAALEMEIEALDAQIARLTERLDGPRITDKALPEGVVGLGRLVTIDFGDGLETFRVEQYPDSRSDVVSVTPTSPLGSALLGATAGTTVTYVSPAGPQKLTIVTVLDEVSAVA
jgi:transcription elongation factor GreA